MPEYTLVVRIPQAGNREINYSINLNGLYESYPDDYFRHENHRLAMSQAIETQSARKVSANHLSAIISKWVLDIKSGLYRTVVTLDLPADASLPVQPLTTPVSNPTVLQTTTTPVNHPTVLPAKQPTRQPLTPTASTVKPAKTPVTIISDATNSNPGEKPAPEPEKPPLEVRTDTNKADF